MYSRPSLPQKPVASTRSPPLPTWLLSEQPKQTHYQGSARLTVNRRPSESELSPFARENLVCEPMATRSQSSSGNCSTHHQATSEQSQDLRCAVARLAREINYCFLPPSLVAQGWNVSFIGFAPAHGDAVYPPCALAIGKTALVSCRACDRSVFCHWTSVSLMAFPEALPFAATCQSSHGQVRRATRRRTRFVS
jgi:hypothetical protein